MNKSSVKPPLLFSYTSSFASLSLLTLSGSDTLQRVGILLAKTLMNVFVIYSQRKRAPNEPVLLCSITLYPFVWGINGRSEFVGENKVWEGESMNVFVCMHKIQKRCLKWHRHNVTFKGRYGDSKCLFLSSFAFHCENKCSWQAIASHCKA